jgi:hypothetical protein
MWCTEVAAGAFLIFFILVSGDIGDHGGSVRCASIDRNLGPSVILVGRSSAFSYSASRYSYSYSKTPSSIQVDHLFREAVTPLFGPFVNEIPILLFEYEYRFTQYEYEKNHWYELLATIMPDGPKISAIRAHIPPPRPLGSMTLPLGFNCNPWKTALSNFRTIEPLLSTS